MQRAVGTGFVTHSAKTDKSDAAGGSSSGRTRDPGTSGEVVVSTSTSEVPASSKTPVHDAIPDATPLDSPNDTDTAINPWSEERESESVVIRKNARLKAKVKAAKEHLERLPKTDRRSRLLHAAVVRRDEVLLDALLQELDDC